MAQVAAERKRLDLLEEEQEEERRSRNQQKVNTRNGPRQGRGVFRDRAATRPSHPQIRHRNHPLRPAPPQLPIVAARLQRLAADKLGPAAHLGRDALLPGQLLAHALGEQHGSLGG